MKYEVQNFENDVITASATTPVLVDFWAEWCAPCHMLSPVLETLAEEQSERWKLVKVDTEKHSDLSERYGIRGIPNVKLFVDGEVTAEFTGALPEYQIRTWLDKNIPGEFQRQIEDARDLLRNGDSVQASALLEDVLNNEADNIDARALLAQIVVFSDQERARSLVENIYEDSEHFPVAEGVRTFYRLAELRSAPDSLPESDSKTRYLNAIEALTTRDYDMALELFIEGIREDRQYDDDGARKAVLAIFKILGEEHAITQKHRPIFNSSLY